MQKHGTKCIGKRIFRVWAGEQEGRPMPCSPSAGMCPVNDSDFPCAATHDHEWPWKSHECWSGGYSKFGQASEITNMESTHNEGRRYFTPSRGQKFRQIIREQTEGGANSQLHWTLCREPLFQVHVQAGQQPSPESVSETPIETDWRPSQRRGWGEQSPSPSAICKVH